MITVITGPPCAGKSTYARQHARPGDIIIDFDTIAQALGSPVTHGHDHAIWKTAIEARAAAIRVLLGQARGSQRVPDSWVIDSRPRGESLRAYEAAGARLVHLTAEPGELHRRATEAGRPHSWHARIDTFLDGKDPQPRRVTRW